MQKIRKMLKTIPEKTAKLTNGHTIQMDRQKMLFYWSLCRTGVQDESYYPVMVHFLCKQEQQDTGKNIGCEINKMLNCKWPV